MEKFWGSTEKVEYRCTTTSLPACNDTIVVLIIVLLHSISIITNFVIPMSDKQTNKQKTSHFFVYSRHATHDPNHTWHSDRGGMYHLCTTLTLMPPRENAYNLDVCLLKATKWKTQKLPIDAYKIWELRKNCTNAWTLRGKFTAKVRNFDSFGGCIPTFLSR